MANFRNDYSYLAHPRIFEALSRIQDEEQVAYGLDAHSQNAAKLIRELFHCPDAAVHFLSGGTQANLVFLSGILKPFEGIVACDSGHINVHESAAIEGTGHKIVTFPAKDGKLCAEGVERALKLNHDEHTVSLRAVYISDSTETGTIYRAEELEALHRVCHEYGLYLFIDGARLGAALTSKDSDVDPSFIAKVADGFTIGGTKNGMMLGEALVIVNPSLQAGFRNHIKNKGAMLAKGYLVGAQFEEAFKDGLYFALAEHSNAMARLLGEGLLRLGVDAVPSPTNQLFAEFPRRVAQKIVASLGCEIWIDCDESQILRFVTSFKTTEEDVRRALAFIEQLKN